MSESTNPDPSLIDETTDFGARVARHLRDDLVVWLTTVSPSGRPNPNPVWFLWDGDRTVRLFSMPSAARIPHLQKNSQVSLNFSDDGEGGDIVVLNGTATVDTEAPTVDARPEYLTKYADGISRINLTPATFAEAYSVPIVITLAKLRGF